MHHFDGAAGEPEGHGPEGALTGPVGYLVEGCSWVVVSGGLCLIEPNHSQLDMLL